MWPWLSILILTTIMCVFKSEKTYLRIGSHTPNGNLGKYLLFAVFLAFRAFRTINVGGDLRQYEILYRYIGSLPWSRVLTANAGYEPGWLILNKLLNYISGDIQILIILIAVVNTLALFWFVFKYSEDPWFSIYIYVAFGFWGSSFNNERQALAIGMLLFSIKYVQERNLIKFLVLILLASMIHGTSVVFIVVYFIYGRHFKKHQIFLAFAVSVFVYFFATPILNNVIRWFPFYFNKYGDTTWLSGEGYSYLAVLAALSISAVFLFPDHPNDKQNLFIYMLILSTILQMISLRMAHFQRLVKLFSVAMIIYLPIALKRLSAGYSRAIAKAIIMLLLAGFYINSLIHDTILIVPYEWIF